MGESSGIVNGREQTMFLLSSYLFSGRGERYGRGRSVGREGSGPATVKLSARNHPQDVLGYGYLETPEAGISIFDKGPPLAL